MTGKLLTAFLFYCTNVLSVYAGDLSENNKHFQSRFEYVSSFFDYVTSYEQDFPLSLNVVSENGQTGLIVVGIKELFASLYGSEHTSHEQLYLSVGKVFLRDTLKISDAQLKILQKFMVDTASLKLLNNMDYQSVRSKYIRSEVIANVSDKMRRAIICYFDRRWYPTIEKMEGDVVNFEYDFSKFNVINIFKGKKIYTQVWDRHGNLISESTED